MMKTKSERFCGQQIVVTGGGTGIGRAIALAFAEAGGRVRVVGRKQEPLEEVASHWPDRIDWVAADIRDKAGWDRILPDGFALDVLVNNAALSLSTDALGEEEAAWSTLMEVNFRGTLYGCQKAAERMGERGGRIMNVTSVHGVICERGSTAYGVAKAAVNQLTKCLAVELAPRKILVNAIAPGFVETPMSSAQGFNELETESFQNNFILNGRIPLRRAGQPEEIARVALFLAEKENSYMTGQILTVDGGLTLTL